MSKKWPGGIINKTAPTITAPTDGEGGSASGIWTISEVMVHEKADNWPKPPILRELWAVGQNESYGQLGVDNGQNDISTLVQVGSLTTWKSVSAGQQTMLMTKSDGTLWGVGKNNNGQLGQGNTTTYTAPVQIGALTTWSKVASGTLFSVALKTDGTLWTWGNSTHGQLGHNNTTNISSPAQVGSLTTWSDIAAAGYQTAMLKTDGTLWGWDITITEH